MCGRGVECGRGGGGAVTRGEAWGLLDPPRPPPKLQAPLTLPSPLPFPPNACDNANLALPQAPLQQPCKRATMSEATIKGGWLIAWRSIRKLASLAASTRCLRSSLLWPLAPRSPAPERYKLVGRNERVQYVMQRVQARVDEPCLRVPSLRVLVLNAGNRVRPKMREATSRGVR